MDKAKRENISLFLDRFKSQQPQCPFGLSGACCKNCFAGPCRIIPGKEERGICGANQDVIAARNLLRAAVAGATCHSDHAREVVLTLLKIGEGKTSAYKIKDENKLRILAKKLKIKSSGSIKKIAKLVALEALEDFRRQEGLYHKKEGNYLNWLKITALPERIKVWKKLGILPINSDLETSHALHQTTMGNDADPNNLLLSVLRMGLVDGYSGLHLATDIQDIIFGTPSLVKSKTDLGTLKEDHVNIVVHGHVPILSQKIVEWSRKLNNEAKKVGAKGINVVGMCCSGIEVLMRLGIPMAGHVLQQELAIVTGVADAVVVDIQCIYPSLQDISSCYHTKLISTIDYVRFPKAEHISFTIEDANKSAKQIIKEALKAYKKRDKSKILIPKDKCEMYGGFSVETIIDALSKLNKNNPLKVLVDAIKKGDILGVVAIVGCRNPKVKDDFHEKLTEILIKNNILVVGTGCWAYAAAQTGLMTPEASKKAGLKLRSFLEKVGKANGLESLPPCLHMGSCVDNSRVGNLVNALANYMKIPIYKLPIVASAPEYMTEKAVAIAVWALSLGVTTHINPVPPVTSSKLVTKVLTRDLENMVGSKILLGNTPEESARVIIKTIKEKRNS